ncbi:hypothetical protein CNEO2_10137 [Clostridium neonatale]|nr:hypothetical protein CNEO2_10137 [Clostridium neonatale]
MGLFIYTEIRPKHINQEEWNEVFNETKTLLNAYKFAVKKAILYNRQFCEYMLNKL